MKHKVNEIEKRDSFHQQSIYIKPVIKVSVLCQRSGLIKELAACLKDGSEINELI
jgi:hypothetical protein